MKSVKQERIIFIDTSVFEANNFFEGDRIRQLFKMAENYEVKILLPQIIYDEILNRANKHIIDVVSKLKKTRNDIRILRNLENYDNLIGSIELPQANEEFKIKLDKHIGLSHIDILDYPTINLKKVFNTYFNNEFPFSKGNKKHEFPDAFAIITIEEWCKIKNKKCTIISNDNDLINYKSELIYSTSNLENYLDWLIKEVANEEQAKKKLLNKVLAFCSENKHIIQQNLETWVLYQIKRARLYYAYFELNIYKIEVERYTVRTSDKFSFISVTDDFTVIEIKTNIEYRVQVEIDDEYSFRYDNTKYDEVYQNTTYKIVHEEDAVFAKVRISTPNGEPVSLSIDQINNGQDLEIR